MKQLDRAIEVWRERWPERVGDVFNVVWKPFYLVPDLPKIGMCCVFFFPWGILGVEGWVVYGLGYSFYILKLVD